MEFLQAVNEFQRLAVDGFSEELFLGALVIACTCFTLFKIRTLSLPLIKLVIVYSMAFGVFLAALYGPEDLLNLTSLRELRRTTRAAALATAVSYMTGFVTPKNVRLMSKE